MTPPAETDQPQPASEDPVKVEVTRNRMGYWAAAAYRDGERIAGYGAAVTVSEALREIADQLKERTTDD